jgi:hypothetical protein
MLLDGAGECGLRELKRKQQECGSANEEQTNVEGAEKTAENHA